MIKFKSRLGTFFLSSDVGLLKGASFKGRPSERERQRERKREIHTSTDIRTFRQERTKERNEEVKKNISPAEYCLKKVLLK
jgi:hypothetical protein